MIPSTSSGQGLSQDEAFARIRLLRSPNVGPVSYAQLLAKFGDAAAALAALPDLAERRGLPAGVRGAGLPRRSPR